MSRQMWTEELAWATASGTAVGTTTTETILFPNLTIPGNFMQDGRSLRLRAFGQVGNVVTAQPTLTIRIRWGGVAGTVLASTGAVTLSATAFTAAIWDLEAFIVTRVNGSSGTLMTMGGVSLPNDAAAVSSRGMGSAGALTPAAVGSLDLTADTALSLTAQWGTSNGSNTITGHMFFLSALN